MIAAPTAFHRIAIEEILLGSRSPTDLYIRISDQKYICVLKRGSSLDRQRLQNYREKGLQFVYVTSQDLLLYSELTVQLARTAAKSSDIQKNTKVRLLKHAAETALQRMFTREIDKSSMLTAQQTILSTLDVMTESQDLFDLLGILKMHSESLFGHSLAVSLVSTLIARGMRVNDPQVLQKLVMGCMLHDIGEREIDPVLLQKPRRELTSAELRQLESHPQRGLEILRGTSGLPTIALLIVCQHHENSNGHGFPGGLTQDSIHPLSRIVALADAFCDMTLRSENALPAAHAIECLIHIQSRQFDKALLEVLASIFNYPTSQAMKEEAKCKHSS